MEARADVMDVDSAASWLSRSVDKGVLTHCRALVLSAEGVEEAAALAKLGFETFLVDDSKEAAGRARTQARAQGADIEVLHANVFSTKPSFYGPVELIYDNSLLASLPPERRGDWAHIVGRILPKGGILACTFLIGRAVDGPPYPVPMDKLTHLLRRLFVRVSMDPAESSVPGRPRLYRGMFRRK